MKWEPPNSGDPRLEYKPFSNLLPKIESQDATKQENLPIKGSLDSSHMMWTIAEQYEAERRIKEINARRERYEKEKVYYYRPDYAEKQWAFPSIHPDDVKGLGAASKRVGELTQKYILANTLVEGRMDFGLNEVSLDDPQFRRWLLNNPKVPGTTKEILNFPFGMADVRDANILDQVRNRGRELAPWFFEYKTGPYADKVYEKLGIANPSEEQRIELWNGRGYRINEETGKKTADSKNHVAKVKLMNEFLKLPQNKHLRELFSNGLSGS